GRQRRLRGVPGRGGPAVGARRPPRGQAVDLTPRTVTDLERPPPPRRRHGWAPALVLALVLAGVAVLLFQLLRSASLYFCNADEVGEKTSCSEGHRFRVQGDVGNMDDC